MGKTYTPKYAMDIVLSKTPMRPGVVKLELTWNKGKPTADNLRAYVEAFADSMKPGGCNDGLADPVGCIPYPDKAVIRENKAGGRVIAEWKAPMFMVW